MKRALWPLRRAWRMFILEAGRASLTRRDPTHPDLPLIVIELRWWQEHARA